MRYSQQFIKARFKETAIQLGWDIAPAWERREDGTLVARVGAIHLDHAACYGGWSIVQICNEGGGQTQVTGWGRRMKGAELVAWLEGAYFVARKFNPDAK